MVLDEQLRRMSIWKHALRLRIITLSCLVLFVGIGSQALVNVFAANTTTDMMTLKVTAYANDGRMADGRWTYFGACAVSTRQFPLGTQIDLYNPDGTFYLACTAEDSSSSLSTGQINLAMPGNSVAALHWGTRYLMAHVTRWGWGNARPPFPYQALTPDGTAPARPPAQTFRPQLELLKR